MVHDADDIVGKRNGGDRQRGNEQAAFTSPDRAEDERPENVELLLDGERPQMQQRLGIARYVEITGFAPQHQIGRKTRSGRQMLAETLELVRQQHVPADKKGGSDDNDQRRKNPPDAADVEVEIAEAAALDGIDDDAADQVAGDDKEDVDADEAALEEIRKCVKRDDRTDGDRAQPIDVGAILFGDPGIRRHSCSQLLATVSITLPGWQSWGERQARCAPRRNRLHSRPGALTMRAEIETIVEEIKQSLGLLRRHL